jgi:hypothetical protein
MQYTKILSLWSVSLVLIVSGCSADKEKGGKADLPTLPDFKIVSIDGPSVAYVGVMATYTITYKNIGIDYVGSFDYWIDYTPGLGEPPSISIGGGQMFPNTFTHNANEIKTIEFSFTPTMPTSFPFNQSFLLKIDRNNTVTEVSESNNNQLWSVSIQSGSGG